VGYLVTAKKSLDDIVAQYTEDLMAERRPRLAEEIAALDEEERSQLMELLAVVRRLKAIHRESPPPSDEFLQHLDSFVSNEITQGDAPEFRSAQAHAETPGGFRTLAATRPLVDRILETGKGLVGALLAPAAGQRWRFLTVAVLVLMLGLQGLLYLQVRRLDQQNRALVARLERLDLSDRLVPLGMPRGDRTGPHKDAPTPGAASIDDLLSGIELRHRLEQRIRELEREKATKTEADRQIAEAALKELREILRSVQKP
jgi:hypothetical protein